MLPRSPAVPFLAGPQPFGAPPRHAPISAASLQRKRARSLPWKGPLLVGAFPSVPALALPGPCGVYEREVTGPRLGEGRGAQRRGDVTARGRRGAEPEL